MPTAEELGEEARRAGEARACRRFVLDLRYNPGGLLNSAVDVAGQFLPPKTLVVSTEGRVPSQSRTYRTADKAKPRPHYPLAILINGGSASGSEIVAGALKDLNRAILVGETTFGKGSVQSVIQLQDGSALRLTTAKYYTPSKQVIHEHGVAPTIRATLTPEQERLLMLQRREESPPRRSARRLANFRDTQLERAVDALKGVMIYAEKTAGAKKASQRTESEARTPARDWSSRSRPPATKRPSAILRGTKLLASEVASQIALHAGIRRRRAGSRFAQSSARAAPGDPARRWQTAGVTLEQIDAFAATCGPGLATSLMIGTSAAKGLAVGLRQAVSRDQSSSRGICSRRSSATPEGVRPAVALVVSGGHTLLVEIEAFGQLPAARPDAGRRGGRSVRQSRQAARPALSRRAECRSPGRRRRSARASISRAACSIPATFISASAA